MPIALDQLSFHYRPHEPVLSRVSAALRPGRITALLGPNAAGKSTLLRLMLGQLTPTAGRVTLDGRDIARIPHARRASLIAYVPQRGHTSFAFTVRQVVQMGRYAHPPQAGGFSPGSIAPGTTDPVTRALERCELTHLADRPFSELSVGQQQRVSLARALAQSHPQGRAILLDEPASAMDLRHMLDAMHLLRELADAPLQAEGFSPGSHPAPPLTPHPPTGLAVLVVLHDLNLAARFADDAWLLHQGSLVAAGPWSDVLNRRTLEPVYGVRLPELGRQRDGRPVFAPEPVEATL